MKTLPRRAAAGFTLIEVLISIAILAGVVATIYSTWTSILKATRVGLDAAAAAQRERLSMEVMEEALAYTEMFMANANWYGFMAEGGDDSVLSFVSRLPDSFPRSGKYGDLNVRRVEFSLQPGRDGDKVLVVKQAPLLMEFDKDEEAKPLILAHNVKKLTFEFWNLQRGEWVEEWTQSNQIPRLVKATLVLGSSKTYTFGGSPPDREITRVITIHAGGVTPNWQMAQVPGPGQLPIPGQPGIVPQVTPGMPGMPGVPGRPPGM
jgi:type II secretion system protein J